MIDGGLRVLFRQHLPQAMWISIESGATQLGIPDAHYLFDYNYSGWIEFKQTSINAVSIRPHQIAFAERYWRMGGRCFLAVRQKRKKTARIPACDDLYIFQGNRVRKVAYGGLAATIPLIRYDGGPSRWDWDKIKSLLSS